TMLRGMTVPDGEQRWRLPDGVAWVAFEGRVALINTAVPDAEPMIMAEPVASLWRALDDAPLSVSQLESVAEQLVDHDPEGFVRAYLDMLSDGALIVGTAG